MRKDGLLGVGAVAIVCCAGLPMLVALAGGVAVAAVLGLAAGAVAVIGLLALAKSRRAPKEPR